MLLVNNEEEEENEEEDEEKKLKLNSFDRVTKLPHINSLLLLPHIWLKTKL